jgi:RecB family exonuclease
VQDETAIVAVEAPFAVPLVDQATGEVLDRHLVGTLDLVERAPNGGVVVVDLKTAARKYTDLQVEASLQLSIYSYATAMNGLADEQEPPAPLRRAHEDEDPRAPPILDHALPGRQRAALSAGGRGPRGHRGRRLPAAGRVALRRLPVPGRCWAWG